MGDVKDYIKAYDYWLECAPFKGFSVRIKFRLLFACIIALHANLIYAQSSYRFDITAQSLNDALVKFAAQAGLQLIFNADKIRGRNAAALSGEMSAEQALMRLLEGSGYTYRFIDAQTVTLFPVDAQQKSEQYSSDDYISPNQLRVLEPTLVLGKNELNDKNRNEYRISRISSATKTDTPVRQIPQSIQALPRALIDDQQNLTIGESLRNVSGVTIGPPLLTPSFDFTRIRGFRAEHLLDGFTQYYNPGDRESLVNVERIEVLKGPNGLLYGGGSGTPAGGVVNIVSKLPEPEKRYQAGFKYGSYQYYQPWIDVNYPANDALRLRFTAEFTSAESHIDVIETRRFNVNPSVLFDVSGNTKFTLQGKISNWQQQDYQGLPATGTIGGSFRISPQTYVGNKSIDPSRSEFYGVWGSLEHAFEHGGLLKLKARYAKSSFNQKVQLLFGADGIRADLPIQPPSTWWLFDTALFQKQQEFSLAGTLLEEFEIGPTDNKLLIGGDYSRFDDKGYIDSSAFPVEIVDLQKPSFPVEYRSPTSGESNVFVTNQTYGIFLQWQSDWLKRLHTLGSVRLGWVDIGYVNSDPGFEESADTVSAKLLPRVGAVFDINDFLSIYGGYSRSMRGQPFVAFSTVPKPEIADNLEVGLKFDFDQSLNSQLVFYRTERDQIAIQDNNDSLNRSVALGKQRSQGIELDLLWQPFDDFRVNATYAYIDASYLNDQPGFPSGTRITGVPVHSGRLWLNQRLDPVLDGLNVGVGVYMQSESPVNVEGIRDFPGFYSVDSNLNYDIGKARFSLSLKNLTDQRYYEFLNYFMGRAAPVTPLSVFLGVSFHY